MGVDAKQLVHDALWRRPWLLIPLGSTDLVETVARTRHDGTEAEVIGQSQVLRLTACFRGLTTSREECFFFFLGWFGISKETGGNRQELEKLKARGPLWIS